MHRLVQMTSEDVADVVERYGSDTVLVVALGSTEQHGPHLPLMTDTMIASALAERLSRRQPAAIVGPSLTLGASGEHQSFPGTLSIGQDALESVLVELVRSATLTFPKTLLLNGHGGNAATIQRAVLRLRHEGHDVASWSAGDAWTGDAHAGLIETSVMLEIAPEQVREDAMQPGNTDPLTALWAALVAGGIAAVSENGILGDPTGATAAYGRQLLDQAVESLQSLLRTWDETILEAA